MASSTKLEHLDRLAVGVLHDHVPVEAVAAHDLRPLDDALMVRAVELGLDRRLAGGVELVERDGLRVRGELAGMETSPKLMTPFLMAAMAVLLAGD